MKFQEIAGPKASDAQLGREAECGPQQGARFPP
jgi:hypothetical protein